MGGYISPQPSPIPDVDSTLCTLWFCKLEYQTPECSEPRCLICNCNAHTEDSVVKSVSLQDELDSKVNKSVYCYIFFLPTILHKEDKRKLRYYYRKLSKCLSITCLLAIFDYVCAWCIPCVVLYWIYYHLIVSEVYIMNLDFMEKQIFINQFVLLNHIRALVVILPLKQISFS